MATRDEPDDVAKARLHQAQQVRRAEYERRRLAGLSGSRTARARLADAWSPVREDPQYPELPPSA